MIHSVISVVNLILALGLLVFLGFLYAVIKKESGKWTAVLVVFMGLVLIDNGAPDREMDNHLKEFTLYNSPVIKSNRQIEFETQLGGLINIKHSLSLNVPKTINDSTIRVISQNSFVPGWTAGFKYKASIINLEQTADHKIKYTVAIHATSRLLGLGLLNYSTSKIFVGEK